MKVRCKLVVLFFLLASHMMAARIVEFPEIIKPHSIEVNKDELIIVDGFSINVYSSKTFKLKTKFGKKGDGPGEFPFPPRVDVFPDFIFAENQYRIFWFSRGGKLLKEKKVSHFTSYTPFKDIFIGQTLKLNFKDLQGGTVIIEIINSDFGKIKEIYNTEIDENFDLRGRGGGKEEWKLIKHFIEIDMDEKTQRIFIADSRKGFYIEIFDGKGNKMSTINKKIDGIKVPDDFKKKAILRLKEGSKNQGWNNLKNRNFTCYKTFPQIRAFKVSDGKIYVLTYKTKENKTEFIILDQNGDIIKKVFLPIRFPLDLHGKWLSLKFDINDGKLYHLAENEDTEMWELHIYDLNLN